MLDPQLVLALVRAQTRADVAAALTSGLTGGGTALCRVWLHEAPDVLRLVASAGRPLGGGSYHRVDGSFGRLIRGVGKIGLIAETARPLVVRAMRGDEDWLQNPGWAARQGVRSFVGLPLVAGGVVDGVLARFDRAALSDDALRELGESVECAAERLRDLRDREAVYERLQALEMAVASSRSGAVDAIGDEPGDPLLPRDQPITRGELRVLEKRAIETALARTGGRVFGPQGAARMLGMKPTTLASRLKALGIPSARASRARLGRRVTPAD